MSKELKWFVLRHDFNSNKIVMYNVLKNWEEPLKANRKKKRFTDRDSLKEYLRKELMYYYWCKSEHEIAVGSLFVKDIEKDLTKIDIWTQLEPNLDNITDYIIATMNFKFNKRSK